MSTDQSNRTEFSNLEAADLGNVLGGAGCCVPGAACCVPGASCCPPAGGSAGPTATPNNPAPLARLFSRLGVR